MVPTHFGAYASERRADSGLPLPCSGFLAAAALSGQGAGQNEVAEVVPELVERVQLDHTTLTQGKLTATG